MSEEESADSIDELEAALDKIEGELRELAAKGKQESRPYRDKFANLNSLNALKGRYYEIVSAIGEVRNEGLHSAGISRVLGELKLLNKVSIATSVDTTKPIAVFLRGGDDSGRNKTLIKIITSIKGGTRDYSNYNSSKSKNIQETFLPLLSPYEDALIKANFVMRAFTVYRKYNFKSESGVSVGGGNFRSFTRGGLSEPIASPVSASINKFEIEIDSESNEIQRAELSCVLLDFKVLMGRIMKTDSNLFNFNIFYDL
jgi:hypothetical protein